MNKIMPRLIGLDIMYAMPWDKIQCVLDISADKGLMSVTLAKCAKRVVTVQAGCEEALWISDYAKQKDVSVLPVVANAPNLPFGNAQFDLITLNGLSPDFMQLDKDAQLNFFRALSCFLKPKGHFYLGTKSWHVLQYVFGISPNDTKKYSWDYYAKLFKQIGLQHIQVLGVFDGYDHQRGLYDINNASARREILARVTPPISRKGKIKHYIKSNPLIAKKLEQDVLIIGSFDKEVESLFWPAIQPTAYCAQLNTVNKCFAIAFEANEPTTITEFAKGAVLEGRCSRTFNIINTLENAFKDEIADWTMRWARPIEQGIFHGKIYYRYEYLRGQSVDALVFNDFASLDKQLQLVDKVMDAYVTMCLHLATKFRVVPSDGMGEMWIRELEDLAQENVKSGICLRIQEACDYIKRLTWQVTPIHGDLTFSNLVTDSKGRLLLYDWENASLSGLVAVDLVRLCYDILLETAKLPAYRAEAILMRTFTALKRAGCQLNMHPADWHSMETIYLAQQAALQRTRIASMDVFLTLYKNREFMNRLE